MDWLAGHMLGDWLLQNRWLAEKKLETWWGLVLHVSIATISICFFTGWLDLRLALVFVSHMLIDWLRLGKRWPDWVRQGVPYDRSVAPLWLGLIMDQALHIICYTLIGWV